MKLTKTIILLPILVFFLSAGCSPFSQQKTAGLVKTTNGGANWLASNTLPQAPKTSLSDYNISKLAFAPSSNTEIYAGTYNGGLFKSEDAGANWVSILSRISVYDLAVNPEDSKIIFASGYVANQGKLLKTVDGGKSWEEIYSEGAPNNSVRALALNPTNLKELAIGLSSGNVVKSLDGGKNWVLLKNFEDRVNRMYWQGGMLYVLLQNKGLYASSDNGINFVDLTEPIISKNKDLSGFYINSTEGVSEFSQFAVSPSDPKTIYITTSSGVFQTLDGGKSWVGLKVPIQNNETKFRAVAFAPSNSRIVYMSAGNTIYKTLDNGNSFQTQGVDTKGFINYILVNRELPQIAFAGIFSQ